MKKIYTCLIILLLLHGVRVHSQVSFSLEEAMNYALTHNNAMRLQQLQVEDAKHQINEYKAFGLPKLDAGVNYSYFFKRPNQPVEDFLSPAIYGILFQEQILEPRDLGSPNTFEFSLFRKNNLSGYLDFQTLLFDGSFLQGLKAAKIYRELTASRTAITKKTIKENVTKAYLAVLIAERTNEIIAQNISNVQKTLEETQILYDNGFAEQLDVDRLEVSFENLNTEYENLIKLIEVSYNVLKYQMSYPLEEEIRVSEELELVVDQMIIGQGEQEVVLDFNNRPEYKALNKAIELDHVDIKRLKHGYLPRLKAFANAQESLQRDNLFDGSETGLLPNVSAGLSLELPIFDGNEKKAQIQRAKIRKERNEIQKSEFERGVILETQNAAIQLSNSRRIVQNRKKTLQLNENIFAKTQIKFKEGVGSSVELSQAEAALYQAQSNYIESLYDLILAKVDLDLATGNLK